MAHEPQNEDAILLQVLVDELGALLLVLVALQFVHEAQVLLDVAVAVAAEDGAQGPGQQREAGDGRDKDLGERVIKCKCHFSVNERKS